MNEIRLNGVSSEDLEFNPSFYIQDSVPPLSTIFKIHPKTKRPIVTSPTHNHKLKNSFWPKIPTCPKLIRAFSANTCHFFSKVHKPFPGFLELGSTAMFVSRAAQLN